MKQACSCSCPMGFHTSTCASHHDMPMIFHATAPFSVFCDDGVVARPFWRIEDAHEMVAAFPEHSFRIFERRPDGTMVDRLADECHGYDLDGNPVNPDFRIADEIVGSFSVDGEPIDDLQAFLADNEFDDDTLLTMSILRVGDSMHLGGGAAPLVTIKREG